MRKILALVLVLGICGQVFADVTAEIVGKDIDENGNIIIKTQYKIDGVEVQSRYPKLTIKDKDDKDIQVYYWVTRYTVQSFAGMNETQTNDRIKQDLSQFAKSLIAKKYISEENAKLDLSKVIGQKITETNATIQVSPTLEWTVKTDGSKVEKIISNTTVIE